MKKVVLIFPNQLFKEWHFPLDAEVYIIEEQLFFCQYAFHKQKIAFHRASMKCYESYLIQKGIQVHYISASHQFSDVRKCLSYFILEGYSAIYLFRPVDQWLEQRCQKYASKLNFHWMENPSFMNTSEDLKTYFRPELKRFHQTDFYKWQRKKWNILMENDNPTGEKWTFDTENRKKYPKHKIAPKITFPKSNPFWEEAVRYTEQHFAHHYGELSKQALYPTHFEDADAWLHDFLKYRFAEFGIYEDSIVEKESILHHSVLSPLLNAGLLTPQEVLQKSLNFAKNNAIPLNSVEGFVRQILGWREFVRGLYEHVGVKQRNSNFWQHQNEIPASFYNGTTGIPPIDATIKKLLKTGYVHHIERLMLLCNFMNLCGFHPQKVYQWFMELFIDAYDWVMVPNVFGMSLYADGGLMSTKPYLSGSNYVLKMSDYEKGNWQEIWDGLFWNFLQQYRSFFLQNPRLSMLIRNWDKMEQSKKEQHLYHAKTFLEKLNT